MKKIKSLVSFLLVIVLMSGIITPFTAAETNSIPANEWMKYISNDAYLNSMNIPGTHDSGMYYCDDLTADYAITQKTDIPGQLEAGARIFDIRLRYSGNNTAMICHGQGSTLRYDAQIPAKSSEENDTYYYYDTALRQIADYLIAHPSETVILTVQHEYKADDVVDYDSDNKPDNTYNINTAIKSAEEKLEDWLEDKNNPTLSHIIRISNDDRYNVTWTLGRARGKVIIFEYGTGFGDLMPDARNNYEFTFAEKWNVLFPYFNSAEDQHLTECKNKNDFRAAYTSSTGQWAKDRNNKSIHNNVAVPFSDWILPTPEKEGKSMRKLLLAYPFEKGAYYGWVSMDFVDEELARKIFDSNLFADEPQIRVKAPQTYISDIRGFLDDDYDDALEECLNQGYQVLIGKKADNSVFRDMNPDGDPIVIGYKTTTNPNNAIRDIVGTFDDDDGPKGYTKVEVDGSVYNYFTRFSGWSSEDTYLFYSKSGSKKPITAVEILDSQRGAEMVKLVKTSDNFNLQAGLNRFYGISIQRAADNTSLTGSAIYGGNYWMLIVIFILLAAVIVETILLVRKNKKKNA